MAPTSAVARSSVLQKQSQKPLQMESGRGRLSLDSWVLCQPSARPVRTATRTSSQFSFSASSCTTQKNAFSCKTPLTLNVSNEEAEACTRESGCETPKSKKHRIPVVDVNLCPPAPKKARSSGRLSVVCSVEREGLNLLQKLDFSPGYLF